MEMTAQDALRFEKLKKHASLDILGFRKSARRSANDYPRAMRSLVNTTRTKDTSPYLLLTEWTTRIAPEVESLQATRKSVAFRTALAKHLHLSNPTAGDLARRLVDDRNEEMLDGFLTLCYGHSGGARKAAHNLLSLPEDDIIRIRDRFVEYELHKQTARDLRVTIYDSQAPLIKRFFQKRVDGRQVKRYKKQQAQRLDSILARQKELKTHNQALISRILLLELDTVLVLDAHRQYKKQLDKLNPEDLTPSKRLSLFATATKKIREAHTNKQSGIKKLADLQSALQAMDEVLVELFDMTDAQRNALMMNLKEYRDLERQASQITKEQATYPN